MRGRRLFESDEIVLDEQPPLALRQVGLRGDSAETRLAGNGGEVGQRRPRARLGDVQDEGGHSLAVLASCITSHKRSRIEAGSVVSLTSNVFGQEQRAGVEEGFQRLSRSTDGEYRRRHKDARM